MAHFKVSSIYYFWLGLSSITTVYSFQVQEKNSAREAEIPLTDPAGTLYEFARSASMNLPIFSHVGSVNFKYKVHVNGIDFFGKEALDKKMAKDSAANEALTSLHYHSISKLKFNVISSSQDYKVFRIKLNIEDKGFIGEGETIEEAKCKANQKALKGVGQYSDSSFDTYEVLKEFYSELVYENLPGKTHPFWFKVKSLVNGKEIIGEAASEKEAERLAKKAAIEYILNEARSCKDLEGPEDESLNLGLDQPREDSSKQRGTRRAAEAAANHHGLTAIDQYHLGLNNQPIEKQV